MTGKERVRKVLQETPDMTIREIAEKVGLSITCTQYHRVRIRNEAFKKKFCSVCNSELK